MTGLTNETREQEETTTPGEATRATATAASALEVAGLRERVDGVSMKLDEVNRRVCVLEAAQDGDVAERQDDVSEQSASGDRRGVARATKALEDGEVAAMPEPPSARSESPAGAGPATIEAEADDRPRVPTPVPSSVVLMLTDVQFEKWLGGTNAPQAGLPPAVDERLGNRRLKGNATRPTRSDRR